MTELNQQAIESSRAILKDKFPQMVKFFIDDMVAYMLAIKEGIIQKQPEKIKTPAHTIKSSAQLVGAERISNIAKKIEHKSIELISTGEIETKDIAPIFEELKAAYIAAESELKALLK